MGCSKTEGKKKPKNQNKNQQLGVTSCLSYLFAFRETRPVKGGQRFTSREHRKEPRNICSFLQRMEVIVTLLLLCPLVFFTTVTSEQDNVCYRPELGPNIEVDGLQRFFSPGVELALSCTLGHTPVLGPRRIVCGASGKWTKTKLICMPKRCPYPDPLVNGEMYYEDTVYTNTINYTCNVGYTLFGPSTAVCQADGTWSTVVPECKPVSCGLAPIPKFGMIIYDKRIRGNTTDYGVTGTYKCLPPYVVTGNPRAECTASGTWTETPECRVVSCPPPGNIERGYMSINEERDYDFMETVKYGCNGDYVLEGSLQIVCQHDGRWSEKPSCKAPCSVGIQRGRILYKGQKLWIKDLRPNRILHSETVSVYCMNNARKCGFKVPTQCFDGTLKIPECFEEPGQFEYNVRSGSLPSEIKQC